MNNAISMIDFHGKSIPTLERQRDSVEVVTTSQPTGLSGVYVILKPIAEALGLDWRGQRQRIMRDDVLSCVVVTTTQVLPGDIQKREHLCLPIEFLNGWLFGISAKRVKPALRAFLKSYKLECYGVLYRHWHGKQAAPMVQSFKYWDAKRPHWADIARLALGGFKNKDIAPVFTAPVRSANSVGACLRRMYEVGYLNPVEVFTARLKPATAARWAIEKPVAANWGRLAVASQQTQFEFEGAAA
jgi:hypothetical protein